MTVQINDDCILEVSGEVFNVHLRRTEGLDPRIKLSSESAVVNITDEDGKLLATLLKSVNLISLFSSSSFGGSRTEILYCIGG